VCNSSTWEAEAGGLKVQGQLGLRSETLSREEGEKRGEVPSALCQDNRKDTLHLCQDLADVQRAEAGARDEPRTARW
jgi:hypothetical protein